MGTPGFGADGPRRFSGFPVLVDQALGSVVRLIHDRSGTTDDDAYPEGVKPWEL